MDHKRHVLNCIKVLSNGLNYVSEPQKKRVMVINLLRNVLM